MRGKTMISTTMLAFAAAAILAACHEPGGPYPTVTLRIEGTVTDADDTAFLVTGATVELREFRGLLSDPVTISRASTDSRGHYALTHSFTSVCTPADNTTDWLEVSADGYELQSTFTIPEFSAPVIYCTSRTQVINVELHRKPIS